MARRVSQAQAIAEVAALAGRTTGHTRWIGIDGPGAAGKSSFAARIAAQISDAEIVSVDDFWGHDVREWDWARFIAHLLTPLRDEKPARYRRWDWDLDRLGDWHAIAPGSLVIVEGVSATRTEVPVPWLCTIWVCAPRSLRLARAERRDGTDRMQRWLNEWIPAEEAYARDQRPVHGVDLLVRGDESVQSGTAS